jgi:hypothetical protein
MSEGGQPNSGMAGVSRGRAEKFGESIAKEGPIEKNLERESEQAEKEVESMVEDVVVEKSAPPEKRTEKTVEPIIQDAVVVDKSSAVEKEGAEIVDEHALKMREGEGLPLRTRRVIWRLRRGS